MSVDTSDKEGRKNSARILGRALTRQIPADQWHEVSGGAGQLRPTGHMTDGGGGNTWTDTNWDDFYA